MKPKLFTITATAIAVAFAAAVGYAAIPASNGVISACRDAKGHIKLIDAEAGATCPSTQQLLSWNQQGAEGPQGPAGPPGPASIVATSFASGAGHGPTSTLGFVSPTAQATVGFGEHVHVVASKAMGSTLAGGGTGLDLLICFRSTFIGSPLNTIGSGVSGLSTPQYSRQLYTLSADFLPGAGTFNFGLCGVTLSSGWNSNDTGYVTVVVHK